MMKSFLTMALGSILACQAQAESLPFAPGDPFLAGLGMLQIRAYDESAMKIFNALQVPAKGESNEDGSFDQVKSLPGIICTQIGNPRDGSYAVCSFDLDIAKGVVDAQDGKGANLSLVLPAFQSGYVYSHLTAAEKKEDDAGNELSKTLPGIACRQHKRTKLFECVISVDAGRGVIR